MPLHDWSSEDAGIFHAMHLGWLCRLMALFNNGVLPNRVDALTQAKGNAKPPRRRMTILKDRDILVAAIEIVSARDKPSVAKVRRFAREVADGLRAGIHHLVIDPLPPRKYDGSGMHAAIFQELGEQAPSAVRAGPLQAVSYRCDGKIIADVQELAIGNDMPDVPVWVSRDEAVFVPLQYAYDQAMQGMPASIRERVGGG